MKEDLIKEYNDRIDKAFKDNPDSEDIHDTVANEGDFTAREVAGYYLQEYSKKAFSTWFANMTSSIERGYTANTNEEVTKLLANLI